MVVGGCLVTNYIPFVLNFTENKKLNITDKARFIEVFALRYLPFMGVIMLYDYTLSFDNVFVLLLACWFVLIYDNYLKSQKVFYIFSVFVVVSLFVVFGFYFVDLFLVNLIFLFILRFFVIEFENKKYEKIYKTEKFGFYVLNNDDSVIPLKKLNVVYLFVSITCTFVLGLYR